MSASAKPKAIAILLPDLRVGGVERVRLLLAEEFLARGYEVDLVLLSAHGELLADAPKAARIVDLKARRFRHGLAPLVRYLRERRPSALLGALWPVSGLAVLARWLAGVRCRCVISEHSNLSHSAAVRGLSDLVNRRLGRLIYGGADAVVAVSQGVKADLAARTGLPAGRITVIHNPIRRPDLRAAADPDVVEWWRAGGARMISVGALKPAKDFPTLLRAFATMERHDARLLILGEGGARAELTRLVEQLGLGDRVSMPGLVRDPYPYLMQADLFVLSSAWEGLGNVITEALMSGVPVVSTDCPSGPAEILENGRYGRLTPVGDTEALARAMEEALAAPVDRALLKRRAAEFSVERAADQYLALLDPPAGSRS